MQATPELLQIFVEETTDLLAEARPALAALRLDPSDTDAARCLHRVAHTVKTSAGLMGFSGTQQFALAVEQSLGAARKGEAVVEERRLDALDGAFAFFSEILEAIAAGDGEDVSSIAERTDAFRALLDES